MTDRNRRPAEAPEPHHVRPRKIWMTRGWLEQEAMSNPWRRAERELWGEWSQRERYAIGAVEREAARGVATAAMRQH